MYALIDCDNFYVSCERVFRPEIKNRPIAVLSNNDGCIISRSQEVKDIGVKMGVPFYQARQVLKKHDALFFSSNYELYGDMSERVMATLRNYSSNIEIYSIDEAFIELNNSSLQNFQQLAEDIVRTVQKWTGIPVKVGIAPTKTLCKVAAELVKKNKILKKYSILVDENSINSALQQFDVGDLWGIGRATDKKLNKIGINTASKLLKLDENYIRDKYGINLLRTATELRGRSCFDLETIPEPKKSIRYSRSFSRPLSGYNEMRETIVAYASKVAAKLRKNHLKAQAVSVYLTTNYFRKDLPQYANSTTISLPMAENSIHKIVEYSIMGFDRLFKEGFFYKKTGVIVTGLVDEKIEQLNLFSSQNIVSDRLSQVIDSINSSYRTTVVKLASEGISKEWEMSRNQLSKRYTTSWDELLDV